MNTFFCVQCAAASGDADRQLGADGGGRRRHQEAGRERHRRRQKDAGGQRQQGEARLSPVHSAVELSP